MKGIAVIILAAGAARRMNQAKMLLSFGSSTILEKIIIEVKAIQPNSIAVVTGFYHDAIEAKLHNDSVDIVFNENWQSGVASSIVKGLKFLQEQNNELKAVLILIADQPFLNRSLLREMIQAQAISGKGIIAASYAGINGTPVLFTSAYFSKLEKLSGDKGAGSILQLYSDDLMTIPFPLGEIDIDTEDDYKKFLLK